jgi:hypothetical protein
MALGLHVQANERFLRRSVSRIRCHERCKHPKGHQLVVGDDDRRALDEQHRQQGIADGRIGRDLERADPLLAIQVRIPGQRFRKRAAFIGRGRCVQPVH